MARAQRTVALRIVRAYRTVSADGSSMLASMLPADLAANERLRTRRRREDQDEADTPSTIKRQERAISLAAWQARWDRSSNARWTHSLLPDVGRWLSKPTMGLTFHLTQALTGHGCFRSYLKRMNRAEDAYCVYCMDPEDTADHTIFACPRWTDDRARMTELLRRPPNAADVEELLCGPLADAMPDDPAQRIKLLHQAATNRKEFLKMVHNILRTKEEDEREEQSNG